MGIYTESGVGVYVLIPLTIPYEYFTEHNCVLVSQQCLGCMLVCVGEPGYKVPCELYILQIPLNLRSQPQVLLTLWRSQVTSVGTAILMSV